MIDCDILTILSAQVHLDRNEAVLTYFQRSDVLSKPDGAFASFHEAGTGIKLSRTRASKDFI